MTSNIDILHLTTSHNADDNRITFGQAESLNKKYKVAVAGLIPRKIPELTVDILEIRSGNRFKRILHALKLGIQLKPKAIQMHDPEMLLPGVLFKLFGTKIVFDFHEDYAFKYRKKEGNFSLLSFVYTLIERISVPFYSLIIVADSHTYKKYSPKKTIILGNYPTLNFIDYRSKKDLDSFKLVYVGGISKDRGLVHCVEVVNKVNIPNVKLHIIGASRDEELLNLFNENEKVVYHGRVPWEQLNQLLATMDVGLALYQPIPAYLYCPGENIVKLFEYAGLGIPFVMSDFPGIRNFLTQNNVGVLVDPTNSDMIAKKIEELYYDKDLYNRLSESGIQMVKIKYNWENQEKILIEAYDKIL